VELEICTETMAGALAAESGGASRIELCARLDLDGLTPDLELLQEVRQAVTIPVFAMVRPYPGGFVLSEGELVDLRIQLQEVQEVGCDGIVLGMLLANREVHRDSLRQARAAVPDLPLTFHRAFDHVRDQARGLEDLIDCGVDRVLTSGGKASSMEGVRQLHSLVERAGDRCGILVGGGVRAVNLKELRERTGAKEFHSGLDGAPTVETVAELVALLD
jgi:copper homeostasis protein